ncbi:PD-(D/E)XK nuclease family protein [Magnetococcales bacterium HHB-1]
MSDLLENLFDHLDDATLVITVNQRLARFLQQRHDAWCWHKQKKSWVPPEIYPNTTWLEQLWEKLWIRSDHVPPHLLSPLQEREIWKQIILQDPRLTTQAPLLRTTETAEMARQAWQICQTWKKKPTEAEASLHEDSQFFHGWVQTFQQKLKENNWHTQTALPDLLAGKIDQLPLPEKIIQVGFLEITPQWDHFLGALKKAGCQIDHWQVQQTPETIQRHTYPSAHQEWQAAARWSITQAKRQLKKNPDHAPQIAIVIPDLTAKASIIRDLFYSHLYPGGNQPDKRWSAERFTLSAAPPLLDYPPIWDALALLELTTPTLDANGYHLLLRTPFCHGATKEFSARAALEAKLRQDNRSQLDWRSFIAHLRSPAESPSCPQLAETVAVWYQQVVLPYNKGKKERKSITQWHDLFLSWLQQWGWPGERSLTSANYQTLEAWKKTLNEWKTLDTVTPPLTLGQARNSLYKLCQQTTFQPETPQPIIHVLGILEAVGTPFDALWVTSLSDTLWPPAAKPNPFLPARWQREHQLPHASNAREQAFAKKVTEMFSHSAPTVIFSYPQQQDDQPTRISPLIAGIPETDPLLATDPWPPFSIAIATNAPPLERYHDIQAPPFPLSEKLPGGAALLQAQARCPFSAFAHYRLNADPLVEPYPGLDPATRGILVHHTLRRFWDRVQTSVRLHQLTPEQEQKIIQQAIHEALQTIPQPTTAEKPFYALEQKRLQRLISQWLQLEKKRPDPFTVLAHEKEASYNIEGLRFTLHIDRIDQLAQGDPILLDYKTGRASPAKWFGERPEAPQVPLYSLTQNPTPHALAFAQVRSDGCQFLGISKQEKILPGVTARAKHKQGKLFNSWKDLQNSWRDNIQKLSLAFQQGEAQVDPTKTACDYCTLPGFCRIFD